MQSAHRSGRPWPAGFQRSSFDIFALAKLRFNQLYGLDDLAVGVREVNLDLSSIASLRRHGWQAAFILRIARTPHAGHCPFSSAEFCLSA